MFASNEPFRYLFKSETENLIIFALNQSYTIFRSVLGFVSCAEKIHKVIEFRSHLTHQATQI